jgi:hypothetical protein
MLWVKPLQPFPAGAFDCTLFSPFSAGAMPRMDIAELSLRIVGAFYAFAGYVATRAALTSRFLDRAIAAISLQKPSPADTAQFAWLLCAATVVLAGGLALLLLLDLSVWLFLVSSLGQAAYLFVVAPRYFDAADPPDAGGRRQSTNAFVLYATATAFVLWAGYTGRLMHWGDVPQLLLALAVAAFAAHIGYVIYLLGGGPASKPMLGGSDGEPDMDAAFNRSQSKRIKVMAEYDAHPLWALDEDLYGDFPPEELGLSAELTKDLNAWAEAYTTALNRDDPMNSLWSDEQHRAHAAAARPLAVRLARERPDLMVYILDGATGVVQVHADETI